MVAEISNRANHVAKNSPVFARILLGKISDVSHIHKLIYQLASVTGFILEVSQHPFPKDKHPNNPNYTPITKTIDVEEPINDPDSKKIKVGIVGHDIVVVGWVIFFPNYPAFLAKQDFHVDNLFVREFYREMVWKDVVISSGSSGCEVGVLPRRVDLFEMESEGSQI
ncbi:hypothetical protein MKW94_011150 [Papaver nudicaule]|uniref:Uncharacterized protein n=1 Tax=Papaver nudicaule TaxID=74823 RepID=A0AA42B118_PAPNU|nr:hypothetical protein [Papaver nudicaule]